MKRLYELLAKFCPDGVEYKSLGDIGTSFIRGSGIKRDALSDGGIPCVRYGEIYTSYDIGFERCRSHTTIEVARRGKSVEYGDILFAITGESVDEIAKSCAYLGKEMCYAGGDIVIMKHNQDPRYLSYALSTTEAQAQKSKGRIKSKVVHSSIPALRKIIIPIPPLPVQKEIVRSLDGFTGLIDELEAELVARRKQYEQYREKLLTFGDEVEWKILSDVCVIKHGSDYKNFAAGPYPVYGSGGIMTYVDRYAYDASKIPSVLLPRKGSLDKIHYVEEPFWNVDTVFYTEIDASKTVPKFMYYYLLTVDLTRWGNVGGVPGLTQSRLNKIAVPHPPLAEQRRIVEILDKFDALCNDETAGLRAEIAARRKQYEYYRERLLTFKKKAS